MQTFDVSSMVDVDPSHGMRKEFVDPPKRNHKHSVDQQLMIHKVFVDL